MNFLERSLDGKNEVWRYLIVLVGGFLASNLIGSIPLIGVIIFQVVRGKADISSMAANPSDLTSLGISQNFSLFLTMFVAAVWLLSSILLVKWLHGRSFSETVNGTRKIRWNRVLFGAAVWFVLLGLYLLIYYIVDPDNFTLQFNLKRFIPLFIISIVMIPLQTTSEEFVFRGYMAQGIAAWTRNRWLAILIPAVLFGLMHSFNPEVEEHGFWITMPQYILFGIIFGFIAVVDDGIELSMGVHAMNNIFLSLFITNDSSVLQTPAVFSQQHINMGLETGVLVLSGVIAIFIFAKKYKWNFSILNKKVISEQEILNN